MELHWAVPQTPGICVDSASICNFGCTVLRLLSASVQWSAVLVRNKLSKVNKRVSKNNQFLIKIAKDCSHDES